MKVLIVSDTHGRDENLEIVINREAPFDMLVHCGDVEGREFYIEALAECPCSIVSGNNDFFSDLPREEEFWIGEYHILITHGHYYGVSVGTERLKEEAMLRGIDIVMYGHTHRPEIDMEDQVTVLNPGSLSYPRQIGRRPSFLMMEIDGAGEAHYTIHYL